MDTHETLAATRARVRALLANPDLCPDADAAEHFERETRFVASLSDLAYVAEEYGVTVDADMPAVYVDERETKTVTVYG